jgi:hypothetical protein
MSTSHNARKERVEARKKKYISLEAWCRERLGTHMEVPTVMDNARTEKQRSETREPRVKK